MARPLIILDRDGVVNHDSPLYVRSAEAWTPIDGAIEAIATMCRAGYDVVIATNQAGVAKGLIPVAELDQMHRKLEARWAGIRSSSPVSACSCSRSASCAAAASPPQRCSSSTAPSGALSTRCGALPSPSIWPCNRGCRPRASNTENFRLDEPALKTAIALDIVWRSSGSDD